MEHEKVYRLSIFGLAISLGCVWGVGMLLTGWFSSLGWAQLFVEAMGSVYIGFDSSFWGGIFGGLWGFFDAAIGGGVFALLYNLIVSKRIQ